MRKVMITGVGLNAEINSSLSSLSAIGINAFSVKQPIDDYLELFDKEIIFNSISAIKREDRSLLNGCAKLSIDAAVQAFAMAEKYHQYSNIDKDNFPIYIANESIENNFSAVENFSLNYRDENDEIRWDQLGKIKENLSPLDMLRLLSTNPLYHVSKVLGLRGGGYPIRRMSLSGLTALEEAFYSMVSREERALVLGVGDLKTLENICAFQKMSLLRTNDNEDGIIPSFASAALVIEPEAAEMNRPAYAEIIAVHSIYQIESRVSCAHWQKLYSNFPNLDHNNLTVVCYNNGVDDLAQEEMKAMNLIFPQAKLIDYKKYYGYTGKANNLIDLITALSDERILTSSYVVINGVGMSVGLGYILIRKLKHI